MATTATPEPRGKFKRIVWPLATAQTLLWAGTYYLFPALLGTWERELGWSKTELAGALTTALLISAALAPTVGREIDRGHSNALFPGATLVTAVLLALLSQVTELWQFYAVWAPLGVAMAASLYEPCFAIITRYMGRRAREAITLVTLLAGFAGTLAFPSAHALVGVVGWQGVALVFAAAIALIAVPLNHYAVSHAPTADPAPPEAPAANTGKAVGATDWRPLALLAIAFAMIAFDHGALISHLLVLLDERGIHPEVAVLAAAMIGPMQVAGRLALLAGEKYLSPVATAMLAFAAMAVANAALYGAGAMHMLLVAFVIFQGAGYGVTSILRPLLVAELLGRRRFGTVAGFVAIPFLVVFALAPSLAGLIWTWGGYDRVIILAAGAAVLGLAALALAARTAPRPDGKRDELKP